VGAATATLRPIEPADAERLRRFHTRLSDETVYRRYHGPHPTLADHELAFLCGADGRRHIARVAIDDDGEIAGVCRLIGDPAREGEGEIAIVVADAAQHHGVGHELLVRVLDEGARAGFRRLDALMLATNARARRLFLGVAEERGIPWDLAVSGGVAELHLSLPAA
jgi:RimJ/RimL family protein N-acetyltransferase